MSSPPIVQVHQLVKAFHVGIRDDGHPLLLRAVNHVNVDVKHHETLGLDGESGLGKSTVGRLLVGLETPTSGEIVLFGTNMPEAKQGTEVRNACRKLQIVFQDPNGSPDPRMRVGDSIVEPLDTASGFNRRERADRVVELLAVVGLAHGIASQFSHAFSGGQRQRNVIARALALQSQFIVCDEPV
jgi:ABC-type glutathione transport system ATPase component